LPIDGDAPLGVQSFAALGSEAALTDGALFERRFRLLRRLGVGGMGQVWLAEQTEPVRREVAVKLIRGGMYDEMSVKRFESERQSLAIMNHPAIARVFEAGTTAQGQPYLVMEYVPGIPITDHCDQHRLSIPDRLRLLIRVCDAVQHAHQKAIIHRDLKPSNVLIVDVDAQASPKIIDFGIAKPLILGVNRLEAPTLIGQLVGTPGFMSPEQLDPTITDLDTRTDVYALGALLYVLLTGVLPFSHPGQKPRTLDEWLRELREAEPQRPSSRTRRESDTASARARARGLDPPQLVRQLRGDLDCIAAKALARDRDTRYGTPLELAADLRRYLRHEAVEARPASAAYQLRKYMRRHWAATAVSVAFLLLVSSFSVMQYLHVQRITREQERATRVTDFITGIFKVADPSEARGNSVTVREILDKAAKDTERGLVQNPEVQSQLWQVMAVTHLNLGLLGKAHELAQRALDTRMRLDGPWDADTLRSMSLLGWILARERKDAEAETVTRRALAGEQKALGPENAETLQTQDHLAVILQHEGHSDQSEQLEHDVVEAARRRLGEENSVTLEALNHLGVAQIARGEDLGAETTYRELLVVDRRVLGADHPETIKAMNNLASALANQARWTEAEPLYREALDIQQRVLGPEHHNTIKCMGNLASLLHSTGRVVEAEALTRQALALQTRTLGPEHPDTLLSESNLGAELLTAGKLGEAEAIERHNWANRVRVLGPKNAHTLLTQSNLAETLIAEGRYAEAEALARPAFDSTREALGPGHRYTLHALRQLGKSLAHQGRFAEAIELYREVIDRERSSENPADRGVAHYGLASVAAAANRPAEAVRYLREAVTRGYSDVDGIQRDADLQSLRGNHEFAELMAAIRTPR
jgi:non-specific serine/threonine protein kinase/serine/threonine-protein kinase